MLTIVTTTFKLRGLPMALRLSEGLGIALRGSHAVGTHGRRNLRFLGGLVGVQPIAWGKDRLNFHGLDDQHAVNPEPRAGLGFQWCGPHWELEVVPAHVPCDADHLKALLNEDIDEANAHARVGSDVAYAFR